MRGEGGAILELVSSAHSYFDSTCPNDVVLVSLGHESNGIFIGTSNADAYLRVSSEALTFCSDSFNVSSRGAMHVKSLDCAGAIHTRCLYQGGTPLSDTLRRDYTSRIEVTAHAVSKLAGSVHEIQKRLMQRLDDQSMHLKNEVNVRTNALDDLKRDALALERSIDDVHRLRTVLRDDLIARMVDYETRLQEQLDQRLQLQLERHRVFATAELDRKVCDLERSIEERLRSRIERVIEERAGHFEKSIQEQLNVELERLEAKLGKRFEAMERNLDEQTVLMHGGLVTALKLRVDDLNTALTKGLDDIGTKLDGNLDVRYRKCYADLDERLHAESNKLMRLISDENEAIEQRLTRGLEHVKNAMAASVNDQERKLRNDLSSKTRQLVETLESGQEVHRAKLVKQLQQKLDSKMSQFHQRLEQNLQQKLGMTLEHKLVERKMEEDELANMVTEAIKNMKDEVTDQLNTQISSMINQRLKKVAAFGGGKSTAHARGPDVALPKANTCAASTTSKSEMDRGNTFMELRNVNDDIVMDLRDQVYFPPFAVYSALVHAPVKQGIGLWASHARAPIMFCTGEKANYPIERARITAKGRFGICTTNPQYELDVSGSAHAKVLLEDGVPLVQRYAGKTEVEQWFAKKSELEYLERRLMNMLSLMVGPRHSSANLAF